MELWLWLLLILTFLVVLVVFYRHHQESILFPPGFPRYPIVGSILSLPLSKPGSEFIIQSTQYAPKYGKLMGYFLGPIRLILVQDFDLCKEMMTSYAFSGRSSLPGYIEMRGINGRHVGIAFTHGQIWKANLRFSVSALKDFGFGKKSIGSIITEEAIAIVETFKRNSAQDVLIHQNFHISVLNIIWYMVAAKRFQHGDPQITGVMDMYEDIYKYIYIDLVFPWLRYVYPEFTRKTKQHFTNYRSIDFIEAYLREMKVNAELTIDDLVGVCMDFFEAGSDTVAVTLSWTMMYLAKYPDVQEKCYLELQSVGLESTLPTLEDRPRLPYCEATIMEIQRLASITPGGLERLTLQDATVEGYNIPKGTLLVYNIWKFHHDPEYFPDPWTFKPERFLSADGLSIVNNEHLVPFGIGKRMCMGASLAKAELFLFFTIIVQKLKVSMPREHKPPSEDEYEAPVMRSPCPFHVHVVAR